jgi:hypothetical protein
MRFFKVVFFALIFLVLTTETTLGQPGGGGPGGEPDVPITGIEILIAVGAALGVRKLLSSRRKNLS